MSDLVPNPRCRECEAVLDDEMCAACRWRVTPPCEGKCVCCRDGECACWLAAQADHAKECVGAPMQWVSAKSSWKCRAGHFTEATAADISRLS